jgi:hypothetical protein
MDAVLPKEDLLQAEPDYLGLGSSVVGGELKHFRVG